MLSEDIREVHIVGGLHPDWEFKHYLEIVKSIKDHYPDTHVKAFTAVEIDWFCEISGKNLKEVLEILKQTGVDALTGGGAEILHPDIRKKICAPKTIATRWEEIHKTAHGMGIPTNATILYGHIEKPFHVVDHLERLRNVEDPPDSSLLFQYCSSLKTRGLKKT
jgi:aminodeoxyfutalosine synthase